MHILPLLPTSFFLNNTARFTPMALTPYKIFRTLQNSKVYKVLRCS